MFSGWQHDHNHHPRGRPPPQPEDIDGANPSQTPDPAFDAYEHVAGSDARPGASSVPLLPATATGGPGGGHLNRPFPAPGNNAGEGNSAGANLVIRAVNGTHAGQHKTAQHDAASAHSRREVGAVTP